MSFCGPSPEVEDEEELGQSEEEKSQSLGVGLNSGTEFGHHVVLETEGLCDDRERGLQMSASDEPGRLDRWKRKLVIISISGEHLTGSAIVMVERSSSLWSPRT